MGLVWRERTGESFWGSLGWRSWHQRLGSTSRPERLSAERVDGVGSPSPISLISLRIPLDSSGFQRDTYISESTVCQTVAGHCTWHILVQFLRTWSVRQNARSTPRT